MSQTETLGDNEMNCAHFIHGDLLVFGMKETHDWSHTAFECVRLKPSSLMKNGGNAKNACFRTNINL